MSCKEQRLQEIKNILNQKIKLINISYVGIKADNKKINIEKILQSLSREISIPSNEGFKFFDFNNARDNINNSDMSEAYKKIEIQSIDDFESEFLKFKNILLVMKNLRNKLDVQLIKGQYGELKLIYLKDLTMITSINQQLEQAKKKINMKKFEEGIIGFIESFRYKIRGELSRHHIVENKEFTKLLEDCFTDLKNVNKYINRINIKCKYVVDISYEVLNDIKFKNALDEMNIEDEDRDLIEEYYKLR